MHTYIVSGLTGSPLYLITGNEPFDPWAEVPGDADGDGDVDQDDLDLITANIGLTTQDGAAGDLNADGTVDAQDLALSVANLGSNGFDALGLGGGNCPAIVPVGFHCQPDCTGHLVLAPINVRPECRPVLCPQQCACGYTIVPMPQTWGPPHAVLRDHVVTVIGYPVEDPAHWQVLSGQQNIVFLEQTFNTFRFRASNFGSAVLRMSYNCCQGYCSRDIPFVIIDCNDACSISISPAMAPPYIVEPDDIITLSSVPSSDDLQWSVLEGAEQMNIPVNSGSQFQFRVIGTHDFGPIRIRMVNGCCTQEVTFNHGWIDLGSDGLPDWWEVWLGLDPHNPDTDGDGILDGDEDHDNDGLANHDEWIYGTDPTSPDSDGDGVSDGQEVQQGSDPADGTDGGGAPGPEDLVDVTLQVGDHSGSHSELWMLHVGNVHFKRQGMDR